MSNQEQSGGEPAKEEFLVSIQAWEWIEKAVQPDVPKEMFELYVTAALGAQCLWLHKRMRADPCPVKVGDMIANLVSVLRSGATPKVTVAQHDSVVTRNMN